MQRILAGINLLTVAGLWAFAVWAFPRLPDRIPLHFGVDGTPDRWGEPSAVNWFLLPVVVLALNLLLVVLGRWMQRRPSLINLPGGQRIDELPEGARAAVMHLMGKTLAVVQLMMNGVFVLVQTAQYAAAMGDSSRGLMGGILFMSLLSGPIFLVWYFLRLQKALAVR